MKVKVIPKNENSKVFVLEVDGTPVREIHRTIFGRKPQFPKELTDEIFFDLEYKAAKRYAYFRLSKKNQPSSELKQALKERLVSDETVQKVIHEFNRLGYLEDKEWVLNFIQSNTSRGRGPKEIEMKLKFKKISCELIKECLKHFDNADLRREKILQIVEKKSKNKDLSDYKERQKIAASVVRRGFSLSEVLEVLQVENSG